MTDMKTRTRNIEISPEAQSALLAIAASRQGAVIAPGTKSGAALELRAAGFVGQGNGLTGEGVIARERLVRAREEAAFS